MILATQHVIVYPAGCGRDMSISGTFPGLSAIASS
jgi:hypothetical protein